MSRAALRNANRWPARCVSCSRRVPPGAGELVGRHADGTWQVRCKPCRFGVRFYLASLAGSAVRP